MALPPLVQGQESPPALAEILVTARKQQESLANVPISINIVGSQRLEAASIGRIAEMVDFVPGLSMTEVGTSTRLYLRGIGSGNNQGFEQSVGQYMDGIYYGRPQLIRLPFLDYERVEILRGPQAVLFGKNSIGGALNFTSRLPGQEPELMLSSRHGLSQNQWESTAVVSGPIAGPTTGRLAWRGNRDHGYFHNTTLPGTEPRRIEDSFRLTLALENSGWSLATLKLEHHDFSTRGRQVAVVRDDPSPGNFIIPRFAGQNFNQVIQGLGQPSMSVGREFVRHTDYPDHSATTASNLTLHLQRQWQNWQLDLVSARVAYQFQEQCDCDFSPARLVPLSQDEHYRQFSHEARFSSITMDSRLTWSGGIYYQHNNMSSRESLLQPPDTMLVALYQALPVPPFDALAFISGTEAMRLNRQHGNTWAAFGQATLALGSDWHLVLGGRHTLERKRGFRAIDLLLSSSGNAVTDPRIALAYQGVFGLESEQLRLVPELSHPGHNLSGQRRESDFTPQVSLEWNGLANTLLYVSSSRGFKAGGFDARANTRRSFEFEDERLLSHEAGFRASLAGGRGRLAMALFHNDYRDIQVSQFDGSLGFNVTNAGGARINGLETEMGWILASNLSLSFSHAWTRFRYTDFNNANCYNRRIPDGAVVDGVALCDATGARGQFAPATQWSLALDYSRPDGPFGSLMLDRSGKHHIHDNLDPGMQMPSYLQWHMQAGWRRKHWSVAVKGRNLGNTRILTYAANLPVSAAIFGTNSYYAFMARPRQVMLEVAYQH